MKAIYSAPLMLAIASIHAHAGESAAQQLRNDFVNGCVARGLQHGDNAINSLKFCTCAFNVLAKELTVSEYIQMDKLAIQGSDLSSIPALASLKPKISECKR